MKTVREKRQARLTLVFFSLAVLCVVDQLTKRPKQANSLVYFNNEPKQFALQNFRILPKEVVQCTFLIGSSGESSLDPKT